MIALESSAKASGERGAPRPGTRPQPTALLRDIFQTKVLSRLFEDATASGNDYSSPSDQPHTDSGAVLNGPPSPAELCGCVRAEIAADLLKRVEGGVFQPADLRGATGVQQLNQTAIPSGNATLGALLPEEAVWEPLERPHLPLSVRELTAVLNEKLEAMKTSQKPEDGQPERRAICPTCHSDVTTALQQLLDSCVSFSALCRLSAFPISPEALNKLSNFVSARRKRARRVQDQQGAAAASDPPTAEEGSDIIRVHDRKASKVIRRGPHIPSDFLSRVGSSSDRLELRNCEDLHLAFLCCM